MNMKALILPLALGLSPVRLSAEVVKIADGKSVQCASAADVGTDGYRTVDERTVQEGETLRSSFSLIFLQCTPDGWQPRNALDPIARTLPNGKTFVMKFKKLELTVGTEDMRKLVRTIPLDNHSRLDVQLTAGLSEILTEAEKAALQRDGSVPIRIDLALNSVYEGYLDNVYRGDDAYNGGTFGIRVTVRE